MKTRLVPALLAFCGLSISALAQRQVVLDGSGTMHETLNQVLAQKWVQVPNSSEVIVTWTERAPDASLTPWYSIALNGARSDVITPTTYDLRLRFETFDPARRIPAVPPSLAHEGSGIRIVQFISQPLEVFQQQIEALGGTVHRYVADHAYLVEMTPDVAAKVAALPYVRWTGAFHPAYRLDEGILELLASGQVPEGPQSFNIECFERGMGQQAVVADAVVALGGTIQASTPDGFRMEVWIDPARLPQLARMDEVHWIDPWGPGGTDMDICRELNGAVPLLSGLNILGQGVRGEVFDSGVRVTHQAFQNPGILLHGANTTDTSHGTNTYGIVFGNGAANINGTGMLPNRQQGIFAAYNQVTQFGGAKTRMLHTQELVDPNGPFRAVFQTCSVGNSQTTAYNSISAEMDDIIYHTDLLILQSQSNLNSQSSRPQAWAKNILSIGGINHNNTLTRNDDGPSGASFGPAADGRVKPDLANVYDSILCPSSSSDTSYTSSFGGTSGATPISAGAAGLMHQLWHQGAFKGHGGGATVFDSRPSHTTAKALLINSAFKYPLGTINRNRQGWGMPDLARLYNDRALTYVVDEAFTLTNLKNKKFRIGVPPGLSEFRVTLVYRDPQGTTSSTLHRINDLSLTVTAPNGTVYHGNNGLATSNTSTSGGAKDTRNTVENVFIPNPASANTWIVEVSADQIVQDGHPATPAMDSSFALVIYGAARIRILN